MHGLRRKSDADAGRYVQSSLEFAAGSNERLAHPLHRVTSCESSKSTLVVGGWNGAADSASKWFSSSAERWPFGDGEANSSLKCILERHRNVPDANSVAKVNSCAAVSLLSPPYTRSRPRCCPQSPTKPPKSISLHSAPETPQPRPPLSPL